jgi:hypothetical protein
MIASTPESAPSWGWGAPWQLWACRLSHVLGLLAVLAMLLALGVMFSG